MRWGHEFAPAGGIGHGTSRRLPRPLPFCVQLLVELPHIPAMPHWRPPVPGTSVIGLDLVHLRLRVRWEIEDVLGNSRRATSRWLARRSPTTMTF